jgi:hypothetical protein
MTRTVTRREIADAVDALLSAAISYEEYLTRIPEDTDDDAIAEVLDLVEHTPKRGLFGVSEAVYAAYLQRIAEAVKRLR